MLPEVQARPRALRHRNAFTLIELIVVVIIIAVLAAVAAVAYNQYASRARSNSVLASAADMRTAVMAAAARDDHTAADEAALLWDQAGQDSAAFLADLSADYAGIVTFTAAADGAPATLQVTSAGSGNHAACLALTEPPTVAAGTCSADVSTGTGDTDDGSTVPGATIVDTFDRADAASLGTASDNRTVWQIGAGAWGISSSQAHNTGQTDNIGGLAFADLGSADQLVQATLQGSRAGIVFRYANARSYWTAWNLSGNTVVGYINGTASDWTQVGSCPGYGTVRVSAKGDTITATLNGEPCMSATRSFNDTATNVGLWAQSTAASTTVDNFSAAAQ